MEYSFCVPAKNDSNFPARSPTWHTQGSYAYVSGVHTYTLSTVPFELLGGTHIVAIFPPVFAQYDPSLSPEHANVGSHCIPIISTPHSVDDVLLVLVFHLLLMYRRFSVVRHDLSAVGD